MVGNVTEDESKLPELTANDGSCYKLMESIDYSSFSNLSEVDCVCLLKEVSKIIYLAYQLDWSLHVCVCGNFLKKEKLSQDSFNSFPRTNHEFDAWLSRVQFDRTSPVSIFAENS